MVTAEPMDIEDSYLQDELKLKTAELQSKAAECERLQKQLDIERFGVCRFSKDNSLISFYTGFTSYMSFIVFLTA